MRALRFRIRDYKCIEDSGWVELGTVTAFVGKNESGKTAALEALQRFNSRPVIEFTRKDFPRDRSKDYDPSTVCVEVEVEPTEGERETLAAIIPELKTMKSFAVASNYENKLIFNLPLPATYQEPTLAALLPGLEHVLVQLLDPEESIHLETRVRIESFVNSLKEDGEAERDAEKFGNRWEEFKKVLQQQAAAPESPDKVKVAIEQLIEAGSSYVSDAKTKLNATSQAEESLIEMLPVFIYVEDYDMVEGTLNLKQFVEARETTQPLTGNFKTMSHLLAIAGLNVDELIDRGAKQDVGSREILCDGASTVITGLVTRYWKQKVYEVEFRVDGDVLRTLIVDRPPGKPPIRIPLEQRSKGFKWQFSFNVIFNSVTKRELKDTVLLLDEPGLHLHAAAQADLLELLESLSSSNQIVYTTHSPFMVDGNHLDRVRVCRETYDPQGDGQISAKYWTGDEESVFPLLSALGYDLAQSLLVGKKNLILEGITDFWYLTTISGRLFELGKQGLKSEITPSPVGGASRVFSMAVFMSGQKLEVVALLDSEAEGKRVKVELLKSKILKKKQILLVSEPFDPDSEMDIEDLIPEEFYLELVQGSYAKELAEKNINAIALPEQRPPRIVSALGKYFEEKGLPPFQKTRPANLLLRQWGALQERVPQELLDNFEKLIIQINKLF